MYYSTTYREIQSGGIRRPIRERIQNVRFTSNQSRPEFENRGDSQKDQNRLVSRSLTVIVHTHINMRFRRDGSALPDRVAKGGFQGVSTDSQRKSNSNSFLNLLMNRHTLNSPFLSSISECICVCEQISIFGTNANVTVTNHDASRHSVQERLSLGCGPTQKPCISRHLLFRDSNHVGTILFIPS
jgi:hypothetical protein